MSTKELKPAKTSMHNLYDAYTSYLRSMEFYSEELQYLQKRLDEIGKANTGKDIMAQVEHFQNQFILTKENIDELKHNVHKALEKVEQLIKQKPTHSDEKMILDSDIYGRNLHDIEKSIAGMKWEFNTFLSKYL